MAPSPTSAAVFTKPRQDRPSFHIAPPQGWINDPNGPLFYGGYYHMFYQHVPGDGCTWQFGLVWAHAVSTDLVHWEHLPHAIVPTPGGLDADGCFSGCATLDDHGVPTILYTGVRLRSNELCGPLPPPECDLQLPFIESQCAARPVDPSDPKLTYWTKVEYPWLSLPPPSLGEERFAGWRDPAIISRPGQDGSDCWTMIIGCGVKDNGGTVLVYTSKELLDGWQLHGELCHGRENGATTGFMWECPILCELKPLPRHTSLLGSARKGATAKPATALIETDYDATPSKPVHLFCISPDACTNPSYYWLGPYDPATKRFDLDAAQGPFRLDLGDVLYAPNILHDDAKDRTLLWGWNQEKRKVGTYDYAGCLSLPRVLWLERLPSPAADASPDATPGKWALHQQPALELTELRHPHRSWRLQDALPVGVSELVIDGGAKMPVIGVSGPFLELDLMFQPAADVKKCSASGLLLQSWTSGADGSAALLYHWDTGVLEVIYEAIDPATLTFSLAAPGARRVGGRLQRPPAPGNPLALRVFLDHSSLEVFTGDGEVLTARVYRGSPSAPGAGIDFISVDGPTRLLHCAAYEMQPAFHSGISADEAEEAVSPLELESLAAGMARMEVAGVAEAKA
ncbi:Putative beta-Fructufuranosidase [Pleodorina starrii]|uniref:Beta-Fructufuranosidase n=1 Tax=Pleodorina starrii TaxID=330485 RepID=A0A9W6BM96_9CHLO|nr:Putative beta-Fructufuranosidase [Pleodorina starrii]GLC54724.1 Putative beta-Fructufuranosidase [Pleodorina starrii]GLC68327.1 Putative beta-Fructufuranosidase [Pleodorina starrii]